MAVKAPIPDPIRDALPSILKAHIPDHPLESAFRMPGGQREKYVLRCFGIADPLVLRIYGTSAAERAALDNGLKCAQLLSGAGGKGGKEAPTYRMVGFDETGATAPFPYRLSTMLWGADAETLLEGELAEDDVARIGTALGGAAAAIHGVTADGFGEPRLPPHAREKTLATAVLQVEKAVRDAERKGEMSEGAFERIAAKADPLFDLLAEAGPRGTLVHGDLRPSAIIMRRGEGMFRLVGVVRLSQARFLDPAYDIATLEADAFPRFPALRAPFYKAYSERRELPPDLELRLTLYEAIRALLA